MFWSIDLPAQGRSQELEMEGCKIIGRGVWGPLKAPIGSRANPGRGARGVKPPGSSRVLNI